MSFFRHPRSCGIATQLPFTELAVTCADNFVGAYPFIMSTPKSQWALVTGVSKGAMLCYCCCGSQQADSAPGGMGDGEVVAFLNAGVNVVATALSLELLEYLQNDAKKYGASLVCQELDVTSPTSIQNAVDSVSSITGGRLDFLISMAAVLMTPLRALMWHSR